MKRLLPIVLAFAVALAYANSLKGPFVFDDIRCIPANPWIRELSLDCFRSPGDRSTVDGRPVLALTLALDYAWGGLDVRVYHVTNLLIHLGAVLLLYGFLRRPLGEGMGFSAALLWGLHPLQTESVTYIIQRVESLAGLFYLLTLYAFVRSLDSSRADRWRALALGACALGMATKEIMVTAPLAVLLYDRGFVSASFREALRARRPFYCALALTWGVLAASVISGNQTLGGGFGFRHLRPWSYLLTEGRVVLHYLRLVLWPQPMALDYGWPPAASLSEGLPAGANVLLLLACALLAFRTKPRWGFWAFWFFLLLAPTSSVMPIADPAFEHRTYLALLGPVVLGVLACPVRMRLPVLLSVALLMGIRTAHRNAEYSAATRIWFQTVRARPFNARAHGSLGRALGERGFLEEASRCFRRSIRAKPTFAIAWSDLGVTRYRQGRTREAVVCFREAVRLAPDYPTPRQFLARIARESEGR